MAEKLTYEMINSPKQLMKYLERLQAKVLALETEVAASRLMPPMSVMSAIKAFQMKE